MDIDENTSTKPKPGVRNLALSSSGIYNPPNPRESNNQWLNQESHKNPGPPQPRLYQTGEYFNFQRLSTGTNPIINSTLPNASNLGQPISLNYSIGNKSKDVETQHISNIPSNTNILPFPGSELRTQHDDSTSKIKPESVEGPQIGQFLKNDSFKVNENSSKFPIASVVKNREFSINSDVSEQPKPWNQPEPFQPINQGLPSRPIKNHSNSSMIGNYKSLPGDPPGSNPLLINPQVDKKLQEGPRLMENPFPSLPCTPSPKLKPEQIEPKFRDSSIAVPKSNFQPSNPISNQVAERPQTPNSRPFFPNSLAQYEPNEPNRVIPEKEPVNVQLLPSNQIPKSTSARTSMLLYKFPSNPLPQNIIKYRPEKLLEILETIFNHIKEILNLDQIISTHETFFSTLQTWIDQNMQPAQEILIFLTNKLKCVCCGQNHIQDLTELRCGDIVCRHCLELEAENTQGTFEFKCPGCKNVLDSLQEAKVWNYLELKKSDLETLNLHAKLNQNGRLMCRICGNFRKRFYSHCLHVCRNCFTLMIRLKYKPCTQCDVDKELDNIFKEVFDCQNCLERSELIPGYGMFVHDEEYLFCLTCIYDFYLTGVNQKFSINLKKMERIEIINFLFEICSECKMFIFRNNLYQLPCGHMICCNHECRDFCKICP